MAFTTIRCPHCNVMLNFKSGPAWEQEEIRAPHIFKCHKCGDRVSTGNSEWTDKSFGERFRYKIKIVGWVISAMVLAFPAAGIFALALTEWLGFFDEKCFGNILLPAFIIFASFFVWITIKNIRSEIKKSIERTNKSEE
jgi:hypothetical protein